MSLSNLGEREPAVSSGRQGKKMLGGAVRPLSPSRITRAKTRDTLLEEELRTMAAAVKDRNGALNIDPDRVQEQKPGGKGRAVGRRLDSHIFGEAKSDPAPNMRIRPVLSDDKLSALMAPDTRKEDAANRLAASDNMVTKMVTNQYPVPINKETKIPQAKKRFDEDVGPAQGVAGFGNLGAKSHKLEMDGIVKHQGVSTKAPENFIPEPKPSARFKGKKMIGAQGPGSDGQIAGSHVTSGIF